MTVSHSSPSPSGEDALCRAKAKVAMHAPLVWQMLSLRKDEYLAWVHEPTRFEGEQVDARLFHSDLLEPLTKTVWWVIPLVWLPFAAVMWAPYATSPTPSLPAALALLATGIAVWTLLEYAVHRWVFHIDDALPDWGIALLLHFLLHGIHHKVPMDRYRLVMPPVLFAALAGIGYAFFRPLALAAMPSPHFHAIFGSVIVGYVIYDLMHYSQHHMAMRAGSYWQGMKSYHMKHHYSGLQNVGYGITSKVWDVVFGTVLDVNAAKVRGRGVDADAIAKSD